MYPEAVKGEYGCCVWSLEPVSGQPPGPVLPPSPNSLRHCTQGSCPEWGPPKTQCIPGLICLRLHTRGDSGGAELSGWDPLIQIAMGGELPAE